MNTRFLRPFSLGCAATVAMACIYAGAQSAPENIQLVSANAILAQNIDAKKAAPGETLTAKLTSNVKESGEMELHKGTTLMGRVDQVEKNGNGPTKLSIVFDQARLDNGQTIPVKATLLAAYPAGVDAYYAETSNNGSLTAVQPRVIRDDTKVDQEPGTLGHIEMRSSVQSKASAVFTNTDGDVKLKRGTRLQLAIAPEAGVSQGMTGGQ